MSYLLIAFSSNFYYPKSEYWFPHHILPVEIPCEYIHPWHLLCKSYAELLLPQIHLLYKGCPRLPFKYLILSLYCSPLSPLNIYIILSSQVK